MERCPSVRNFINTIANASYSIYLYNYIFCAIKPLYKNSITCFVLIFFVFGFGMCMNMLIEKPLNKFFKKYL